MNTDTILKYVLNAANAGNEVEQLVVVTKLRKQRKRLPSNQEKNSSLSNTIVWQESSVVTSDEWVASLGETQIH